MKRSNKNLIISLLTITVLIGILALVFKNFSNSALRRPDNSYALAAITKETIKESIVLYVGSPIALINNEPQYITDNPSNVPIIKNKEVYLPASFIKEKLAYDINSSPMPTTIPSFEQNGQTYVHLPSICDLIGRKASYYSNVIFLSSSPNAINLDKSKHIVYDLIYYFNNNKKSPNLLFSKSASEKESIDFFINYNFEVTDAVIHPTMPIIYMADKKNKKLHSINYHTLEIKSLPLAFEPESLDYFNGEVYATLLKQPHSPYISKGFKGGLAIANANTLKLNAEWNLYQDPFDISIDSSGYIYMSSGSGQSDAEIRSYKRESSNPISSRRSYHMRYIKAHPKINRVYSIDTKLSSSYISSNDTMDGIFINNYEKHPEYPFKGDIRISPDGEYMFNNIGTIVKLDKDINLDLKYISTLDKGEYLSQPDFSDFAFDIENNFIYGACVNSIFKYGYTDYKRVEEFKTSRSGEKLFFRDGMLIGISDYGLQIIDAQTVSKQPIRLIGFPNPTTSKSIKDIDKSSGYARAAIIALQEQDIISGDENGYFYPKNEATRHQIVKVLVNSLGIDISNIPDKPTFRDVPKNHWAYHYVEAAYREGIVNGTGENIFGINGKCTREQMATMLTRALGVNDEMITENMTAKYLNEFYDKASISGWALKSIGFAAANDIMKGGDNGNFMPKSTATREQMALVIYRFINNKESIFRKINDMMANRAAKIFLNEDEINLNILAPNQNPVIDEGVILVPFEFFRLLGADVFENPNYNGISMLETVAANGYTSLTLKTGSSHAYTNVQGKNPYEDEAKYKDQLLVLATAPKIINNNLYIPLIDISKYLGADASWDPRIYAARIKDIRSPKYPNLYWSAYPLQPLNADFDLKMNVKFRYNENADSGNLDYNAKGHIEAQEYHGNSEIKTSATSSTAQNSDIRYEVKKLHDSNGNINYSIKNLQDGTVFSGSSIYMINGEILAIDIDYIINKIQLFAKNYRNSDLIKKQSNISMSGQNTDKYYLELHDRPSILESFGITKLPRMNILVPLYQSPILIDDADSYVFQHFLIEVYINKEGKIVNTTISYNGYKKNKRYTYPMEEQMKPGNLFEEYNIPFEVFIECGLNY